MRISDWSSDVCSSDLLLWAVGLSRRQMVYHTDVAMIFPTEKARKPRKHHIPDMLPVSAEEMLVGETWRKVSWRRGTKGQLACHFAARRVRIADVQKDRVIETGVFRIHGNEIGRAYCWERGVQ